MTLEGRLLSGSYRVLRRLGGGGMGEVYEARHERLPRRFAIKTLQAGLEGEPHLARFRREAELASQLAHPHILEVLDYNVTEEGTPYFVMPLLEGEDLGERLERREKLPLVEAVRIVRQVGAALAATHARGVVHRDLKPRNVFLARADDGQETVKVLDFGVSKLLAGGGGLTREGMLLGSPRYMAPEQALGHAEVDGRADLFALGVMIYEMLAGEAAFPGDSELEVLHRVSCEEPRPLRELAPEVPEAVVAVLARALAKERSARYLCAEALVEDLAAAAGLPPLERPAEGRVSMLPVLAPASGAAEVAESGERTVPRTEDRARRSPRLWPGLLAGALLAAALAGVLLWRSGRELREAAAAGACGDWPAAVARLEGVPAEARGRRWLRLLERSAQGLWEQLPAGIPDQLARLRRAEQLLGRYPALRTPSLLATRAVRGLAAIRSCCRTARYRGSAQRCSFPPDLPAELVRCFNRASRGGVPISVACRDPLTAYRSRHGRDFQYRCVVEFSMHDCDVAADELLRGDVGNLSMALGLAEVMAQYHRPSRAIPYLRAAVRASPLEACDSPRLLDAVAEGFMVPSQGPVGRQFDGYAAAVHEVASVCWAGLSYKLQALLTSKQYGAGPFAPFFRTSYCAVVKSQGGTHVGVCDQVPR